MVLPRAIATIISSSSALVHIHWNDLFIVSNHTQQLWTWTNLVSDHVCPGQETVCTKWNNRRAKLETIGLLQEVIHVIKFAELIILAIHIDFFAILIWSLNNNTCYFSLLRTFTSTTPFLRSYQLLYLYLIYVKKNLPYSIQHFSPKGKESDWFNLSHHYTLYTTSNTLLSLLAPCYPHLGWSFCPSH